MFALVRDCGHCRSSGLGYLPQHRGKGNQEGQESLRQEIDLFLDQGKHVECVGKQRLQNHCPSGLRFLSRVWKMVNTVHDYVRRNSQRDAPFEERTIESQCFVLSPLAADV
jgi:hypothetical protein